MPTPDSQTRPPTERRVAPRVTVGLHVVEVDEDTTYFQYATDISSGGMFLCGTAPREIGHRIMLLFKLPGEDQINRLPAEVVGNDHSGRRGTHFKFVDADDAHTLGRLRAYIDRAIAA